MVGVFCVQPGKRQRQRASVPHVRTEKLAKVRTHHVLNVLRRHTQKMHLFAALVMVQTAIQIKLAPGRHIALSVCQTRQHYAKLVKMENTMKTVHVSNVRRDGSIKASDTAKNVLTYLFQIWQPRSVKFVHLDKKK